MKKIIVLLLVAFATLSVSASTLPVKDEVMAKRKTAVKTVSVATANVATSQPECPEGYYPLTIVPTEIADANQGVMIEGYYTTFLYIESGPYAGSWASDWEAPSLQPNFYATFEWEGPICIEISTICQTCSPVK